MTEEITKFTQSEQNYDNFFLTQYASRPLQPIYMVEFFAERGGGAYILQLIIIGLQKAQNNYDVIYARQT